MTVLSCALTESDMLTHRLDPDDLHEVLHAFHALGTEIVHQYGGYLAQRSEDGFVAYFGYPQAHDDDARRAVLAGLQLSEAVCSRLAAVRLLPEFPLTVRTGIHSGSVVVWVSDTDAQPAVLVAGPTSTIVTALRELSASQGVVISGTPTSYCRLYMNGSPKALTRRIYRRQRHCLKSWKGKIRVSHGQLRISTVQHIG